MTTNYFALACDLTRIVASARQGGPVMRTGDESLPPPTPEGTEDAMDLVRAQHTEATARARNEEPLDWELVKTRIDLTEAREAVARLNRRCQSAESGLHAKSTSVRFKSAVENALRSQLEDQRRRAQALLALLERVKPYCPVAVQDEIVRAFSDYDGRRPA